MRKESSPTGNKKGPFRAEDFKYTLCTNKPGDNAYAQ